MKENLKARKVRSEVKFKVGKISKRKRDQKQEEVEEMIWVEVLGVEERKMLKRNFEEILEKNAV